MSETILVRTANERHGGAGVHAPSRKTNVERVLSRDAARPLFGAGGPR